jgi:hypothetical protein
MIKNLLGSISVILLISCNNTKKETYANNRGPNDGKEPEIVKVKDTIDVFDIIERNSSPKQILVGGSVEEITNKKIISYKDVNKDTILASVQYKGVVHPPAIANPPSDKPFERTAKYKLYKINGDWKLEELPN